MGAAGGYFDDPSAPVALPRKVKVLRVLLFIASGFTLLLIVAGLVAFGFTADTVGALVWESWEGVVALIVGLTIKKPSKVKFWLVIVIAAFYILGSLAQLGQGDPRGFTTLILPILLLAVALRRESRAYFFSRVVTA